MILIIWQISSLLKKNFPPDRQSSLCLLFIHFATKVSQVPGHFTCCFGNFTLSLGANLERPKSDILVFLLWSTRMFLAARSLSLVNMVNYVGIALGERHRKFYWTLVNCPTRWSLYCPLGINPDLKWNIVQQCTNRTLNNAKQIQINIQFKMLLKYSKY